MHKHFSDLMIDDHVLTVCIRTEYQRCSELCMPGHLPGSTKMTTVRKLMAIAPVEVELRMRRLELRQRVLQSPHNHDQILTAMFGEFDFDDNDHDANIHRSVVERRFALTSGTHTSPLHEELAIQRRINISFPFMLFNTVCAN